MSLHPSNARPGVRLRRAAAVCAPRANIAFLRFALLCMALLWAAAGPAAAQAPGTPDAPAAPESTRTFKDWTVACGRPEGAPGEICQMLQEVRLESGTRAMGVMVELVGPEKRLGASLFLPLGLYLPVGVQLRVDEHEPVKLEYDFCTPNNCQVRFELKEPILGQMKAGATGHVSFIDMRREERTLDFSLAGFTAALAELK